MGSSLGSSISSGSASASVGVYKYIRILDILHVATDFLVVDVMIASFPKLAVQVVLLPLLLLWPLPLPSSETVF